MALEPEEIFFRAFRDAEFDICELSLSSSTVKTAQGDFAYVGVPAFVSRAFRHTSIYVRTDRVKKPEDLQGPKVGVPEYQLTANVWARAILEDDYGVKPSDIHWIRGGHRGAGPAGEDHDQPAGAACGSTTRRRARRSTQLLESGEIDGFIAPAPARHVSSAAGRISAGCSAIRSRRPRTISSAPASSRSCTSIGVRRALAERHPWLPGAVLKAFEQAKQAALRQLADTRRRR